MLAGVRPEWYYGPCAARNAGSPGTPPPPPHTARHMTRLAPLVALAAAAGCAAKSGPARYIAPTDQTIVTSTEERSSGAPGQIVYVENRSTVPVTVFSVTLRGCENVKQRCDSPQKLDLKLRPGTRSILARVDPASPERSFGYAFSFGWHADSSTTAAIASLADAGSVEAQSQLAAMERQRASATAGGAQEPDLGADEIEMLGDRVAAVRAEPDSVVIPVGGVAFIDQIRLVVLDANGQRLGRARQIQWRMQPGPARFAPPDSIVGVRAGRARAEFMLPTGTPSNRTTPLPASTVTIIVRE